MAAIFTLLLTTATEVVEELAAVFTAFQDVIVDFDVLTDVLPAGDVSVNEFEAERFTEEVKTLYNNTRTVYDRYQRTAANVSRIHSGYQKIRDTIKGHDDEEEIA